MKDWRGLGTPGIIAFVLAAGLSASMVLAILSTMIRSNPLGESASVFLSTLFGTVVGAIATFLGSSKQPPREPPDQ